MSLTVKDKETIVKEHQIKKGDTGSSEVQVALCTARIKDLTGHFQEHKHDHSSKRGLMRLINRRRKLLDYLKKSATSRYVSIIKKLGLKR
ncbi:MAG: 30S ribosomal protein S15 [Thiotrichales bacterium]|nr:MAG: 30S ribosomal protein S15 [Thiotrichales bacterium]